MAGQDRRCEARPKQSGRKISSLPPINRKLKWARMPFAVHLPHDGRADIQSRERKAPQLVVCGPIRRSHRLLLALQGRREGRGPGESLEAIQPGLAERGKITRTGPLYGKAYLKSNGLLRAATHDPRYALRVFYCSLFAIAWSISLSSAARCSAELMAPTIGSPTMLPF